MSEQARPDVERILSPLKDFQRRTVDYVYHRLYTDPDATRRFLIADEVGLGKTLVARGVVARAVDRLWDDDQIDRIDIVYICSNLDIARQNIRRLNVTDQKDVSPVRRMTMLPTAMHQLHDRKLNFVAFTPGTSLDLRSSGGAYYERVLIYKILVNGWSFPDPRRLSRFMQYGVKTRHWKKYLASFDQKRKMDPQLAATYLQALEQERIDVELSELTGHYTNDRARIDRELKQRTRNLIGRMRSILAHCCVRALEPDLVILDEFQRFRHLLSGDDQAAELAQAVFDYPDAKVLLLSATPYKMYTMYHEEDTENHYEDFLKTTAFLFDDQRETGAFTADLDRYRQAIMALSRDGGRSLREAKQAIERRLRKVMVRTERLVATADRSGMVAESTDADGHLQPADLTHFAAMDHIASQLEVGDVVEYWKSAPYLLNIMDRKGYKIKRELQKAVEAPTPQLSRALDNTSDLLLLSWDTIRRYEPITLNNAKLRSLVHRMVDSGGWRLLWVPPSLPYYRPADGPFAEANLVDFTKTLVFSSWLVVPKAIAMLTSYAAERQAVLASESDPDYEQLTRRRHNLLRFALSSGRLTGMSNFTLLYPCIALATRIDPLVVSAALCADGLSGQAEVIEEVRRQVHRLLQPVIDRYAGEGGREDEAWYWAAPVLLDREHHLSEMLDWLDHKKGEDAWQEMVRVRGEGEDRFVDHLQRLRKCFETGDMLGPPPTDLPDVVTAMVLGSPAITALRMLLRISSETPDQPTRRQLAAAARIAMGFRTLYNQTQTITAVRSQGGPERHYWRRLLDYGVSGNLQATLDEYGHVLRESLGLIDASADTVAGDVSEEIHDAISLQTASLAFDEIRPGPDRIDMQTRRVRCRFALRFGDARGEQEKSEIRKAVARKAFNSPFQPFVLATTSVGQEGLDFHQYCHRVVHWNLPANPVDLEQREGRVHRYKGHVIRRNVAAAYPLSRIRSQLGAMSDPWDEAFAAARRDRPAEADDLVPYWIFETPNGHRVYRHVPLLPLSRDGHQLQRLKSTLVNYRLVLGQPRQEDLLAYLADRLQDGQSDWSVADLKIDLSPPDPEVRFPQSPGSDLP